MAIRTNDPRVLMAPQYAAEKRTTRRPQHRFNIRFKPYEIQPIMLAPVLPGETLTQMMLQSQTWSDPLAGSMKNIGWWLQYNFFYVRHRDLPADVRLLLAQMLLEPGTSMAALKAGAQSWKHYTFNGGMDWTRMCLEHIVSEYFRDEGEDWDEAVSEDGLPLAQIYGRGQSDGVEKLTPDFMYEDQRLDLIDAEGKLYANEMSTMMGHWAAMRDAGLTDMDYQDFMKTYGATVREDEESPNLHTAEDLWSLREFTYPTNTVEPTTGVPAVAAGWRVQKAGGKRVFCDEPGFVFGVCYARPKVYMKNLKGSLAGLMGDVRTWLPALLHEQPTLGHVKSDYAGGPIPSIIKDEVPANDDYWLDLRDLFIHGDQFVNYDPASAVPFLALPSATANRRYAAQAEIKSFFSAPTTGKFEADGLISLSVLGRQRSSQPGLVLAQK